MSVGHGGLGAIDLRDSPQIFPPPVVAGCDRNIAGGYQLFGALELHLAIGDLSLENRELGLCLFQSGPERPLVDREQKVALGDECTILKVNLIEIAANPRAYRYLINGLEAANKFIVFHDVANEWFGNRDNGWTGLGVGYGQLMR